MMRVNASSSTTIVGGATGNGRWVPGRIRIAGARTPLLLDALRALITRCLSSVSLGIDLQRLQYARVQIVGSDEDGQLDDCALVEMLPQRAEHDIRHFDVTGHGIGVRQECPLGRSEMGRVSPICEIL